MNNQMRTERQALFARIAGSTVAIMGIGKKGLAAAKLASRLGGKPFLSDQADKSSLEPFIKEIQQYGWDWETGGHTARIKQSDIIVRSSAVSASHPLLQDALVPILDELDFASAFINKPVLAITGTNGKTITLRAFAQIFSESGNKLLLAGGTGKPLSEIALILMDNSSEYDLVAVEVSALQLQGHLRYLKPLIGCLTQIAADHLDKYRGMDAYMNAKARLFSLQDKSDVIVVDRDCPRCVSLASKLEARKIWVSGQTKRSNESVWVDKDVIFWGNEDGLDDIISLEHLQIPRHHLKPLLLACGIAISMNVPVSAMRSASKNFKGVPHRFENIGTIHGVKIINDSKATNLIAGIAAIKEVDCPMIILVGGQASSQDMTNIVSAIHSSSVSGVVGYGRGGKEILELLKDLPLRAEFCQEFDYAVSRALNMAINMKTSVLLFSPCCKTESEIFRTAEDRGDRFKAVIMTLNNNIT